MKKGRIGTMPLAAAAAAVMIAALIVFSVCFVGCLSKSYRVDYCGAKEFYIGAKDSYRAGARVELCFDLVATDTDYTFYLDGSTEGLDVQGSGGGFIISFTMPEHDVRIEYKAVNTMEYNG